MIKYVPTSLVDVALVVKIILARPSCARVNVVSSSAVPLMVIWAWKPGIASPYFFVTLIACTVISASKKYFVFEKPPSSPLVVGYGGVYILIPGLPSNGGMIAVAIPFTVSRIIVEARAESSKYITELGLKLLPLTVTVNSASPGMVPLGTTNESIRAG